MSNPQTPPSRTPQEIEEAAARRARTAPRPADDEDDAPSGRDAVATIARLRAERRELQRLLADAQTDLRDLAAAAKADGARLREEFASQIGALQTRHRDDFALHSAGVQDELGRDTIRRAWEAQPKATRGASPGEWWTSTIKAHQTAVEKGESGADLPPALSVYLPKVEPKAKPAQSVPRTPWAGGVADQGVAHRQPPASAVDAVVADSSITSLAELFARLPQR